MSRSAPRFHRLIDKRVCSASFAQPAQLLTCCGLGLVEVCHKVNRIKRDNSIDPGSGSGSKICSLGLKHSQKSSSRLSPDYGVPEPHG